MDEKSLSWFFKERASFATARWSRGASALALDPLKERTTEWKHDVEVRIWFYRRVFCVFFIFRRFKRWNHKMCFIVQFEGWRQASQHWRPVVELGRALYIPLLGLTFVNIPFWFFDQDKEEEKRRVLLSCVLGFGEQVGQSPPLLLFRLLFFLFDPTPNRLITFLSLSYSILVVSLISFSLSLPSFSSSYLSSVGSWFYYFLWIFQTDKARWSFFGHPSPCWTFDLHLPTCVASCEE